MDSSQFPNFFSDNSKNNTLGDGVHECTLGSIPVLLKSLDSFFFERSLTPDTTLALQITNSLPGAIVLLWLLHHKFRFFLVPPGQNNQSIWENIPAFCSFLIKIDENDLEAFSQHSPPWDRLLRVEATPKSLKGENKTLQHPEGMMYLRTSGSMGKSKIVSYTLDNLWGHARNCLKHYEFNHRDRVIIPVPIFHLYGLVRAFLPALMGGGSVELQNNSHLIKYLAREREFRPNIAFLTPSLCEMLYKGKRDNTSYRLVATGGQKIRQKLFEAFDNKFGGCLVNCYGSSEMGVITTHQPHDPIEIKSVTAGKPFPGVELRVKATQDALKDGLISKKGGGLLFVRHPFSFSGYVDEEGNYKVHHQADQWYRTGDWGAVDPDGHLRVFGRADNHVNRSGHLVSLSEIETKIGELSRISAVVVLALEEETPWGQTLVAVCVLDTESFSPLGEQSSSDEESPMSINSTSEKIHQSCHEILPPFAVPDRILIFPSLPELPGGKVDQQNLKLMIEKKLGNQDGPPTNGRLPAAYQVLESGMNSSQYPNFLSENVKNNTLGDGIHECTFGSIPSLLKSLDSFFSERSLTPDTTLALQITNSLPGAIVLLWLLHHKFRFYLVPPGQNKQSIWENIPAFCSFLIKIDENELEAFSQHSPPWEQLLRVEATPKRLKGENKTVQHPEGMLYVGTSGSMGKSKIVSYTLENLWRNSRTCLRRYGFNHQDRVMIPIPIFHVYGLAAAFLPALLGGANVELQRNPNIIKYLARERLFLPNIAFLAPLLCAMLHKGKRDNAAYRLIVTGGQKIQPELFEAFDSKFGGCLINSYGCSEMGVISASRPNDPIARKSLTVGQAMPGVEIRLQTTQDAIEEEINSEKREGLLFVRNLFGFSGYIDEEGNFTTQHHPNQWYRTGDWGVVNPDGDLRVIGRVDDRVNRSGYLISLSDIETKIGELSRISAVVVLALEKETLRGQTLVAVCTLEPENSNSSGEKPSSNEESTLLINKISEKIQQNFNEFLPPYAVPDRVLVLPSLPFLPSGKVDRQKLKNIVKEKVGFK